jgi:hypothetical protein
MIYTNIYSYNIKKRMAQWDEVLEQEFLRYMEQDNKDALLYHYYGYTLEEYEEYMHLLDKEEEGHPPSQEEEEDLQPEDYEPDWEWLNDVARGR